MHRSSRFAVSEPLTVALLTATLTVRPAESQTPEAGDSLKVMHREDMARHGHRAHLTYCEHRNRAWILS